MVHNFWFDLSLVLNFLQDFSEVVFLSVVIYSLLDIDDVWWGQTTDQTRVPAQEVHNFLSDHWIMLNFLQEFLKAVFLGVVMKLLLNAPRVWSGQTTDQTRVLAQNVHNYWSDRWIVLKFLQEFPEAVFLGIAIKLLRDAKSVLSSQTTN